MFKKLFSVLMLLLIASTAQATTVHRWEYELNNACSMYASTKYTPRDLFNCLIQESRDYFIWRDGWEKPVDKDVMGILTMYDAALVKAKKEVIDNAAVKYRHDVPVIYAYKMQNRKNLDKNFTQEDVKRIWSAR